MYNSKDDVPAKLKADDATNLDIPKQEYLHHESKFRFDFNEDAMAVEKLSSGISGFAAAADELKKIIKQKMFA